ncbi:MAG: ATP-dependent helicase, partial [Candidatus Omnitrophota bacterium]
MTKKFFLKTAPLDLETFKIPYEKELNPSQLEVVTQAEGPCLVLAGAGSGKTRTLIYRVAYLLEKQVRSEEVLLVTFTNKAAGEMRNRVETLLKTDSRRLWCGTFHHVGNRLLRMYGEKIGLSNDFGILDEEDTRDLIKNCIKSLGIRTQELKFPKPGVVQSVLSFSVNADKPLEQVTEKHFGHLVKFTADFKRIRLEYQKRKLRTRNVDYDDLLLKWIELLRTDAELCQRLSRQFRYCLVDEYQDTNRLQQQAIEMMSSYHRNLLVVGDDAQSIYSFRAADVQNILDFPNRYPEAKIFKLQTNYRSTRQILTLANQSIRHNSRQFSKELESAHGDGQLPQVVNVRDARQEAAFVAQRVLELKESGATLSQMAVLFRAHYQAAEMELELTKRGIPYLVRGGIRFFEQAHVKDVLAYLKIVQNPTDELAWARALSLYPGIGAAMADRVFERAHQDGGVDLMRVLRPEFGQDLPARVRDSLLIFKHLLKRLIPEDLKTHPDVLIEEILDQSYNKYVLMNFENAQERLEDLKELVNFAHTYKTLKDFLADVTLREGFKGETIAGEAQRQEDFDQLVLSTIHQAKGLEWKAVFILSLSEGQFPHARA